MKKTDEFPFHRARRITLDEVQAARTAIEAITKKKRKSRGRPAKKSADKYQVISIRLDPRVLRWAKQKARKEGIGYQTVINKQLLRAVA